MPNWKELNDEIKAAGSTYDVVRRKYLHKLFEYTKRNTIIYYSGWLQKAGPHWYEIADFGLNDADKNGFMTCIHKMDRSKGLDIILHTPGGTTAATESIVDYLRSMFDTNIRAIIPQLSMSGGTMIACACKEIVMGKHSSLGPIDPQIFGIPAHGVIEEFEQAKKDIQANPANIPLWQPIIAKYNPTLIGECEKAIKWSLSMVADWLKTGMFKDAEDPENKTKQAINELGDHSLTLSHARHISAGTAQQIGLNITMLEDNDELQDLVLSVHHACIQTLSSTQAYKITENHNGVAFIQKIPLRQPIVQE